MSFVGRLTAGARDLPFGGPPGALLAGAARHIPHWIGMGMMGARTATRAVALRSRSR
jgi:hypothetical protein